MIKTLILFTGKHCASCPAVKKQLVNYLKSNKTDTEIVLYDMEENMDKAVKYSIYHIPSFLYLEDEKPIRTFVGNNCFEKVVEAGIL